QLGFTIFYLVLSSIVIVSLFLPSLSCPLPAATRPTLALCLISHLSALSVVYTAPFSLSDSFYYLVSSRGAHQLTKKWSLLHKISLPLTLTATITSTYSSAITVPPCPLSPPTLSLVLSTASSYLTLLTYTFAVLQAHVAATDAVHGSEGSVLLSWVRCSCCPRPLKKSISLLPFLALASAGIAATARAWDLSCDAPVHGLTVLASGNLAAYALVGGLLFAREGRRGSKAVLSLMAATVAAGYAISGAGIYVMSKSEDCRGSAPELYYTSLALKSALLGTTVFVSFFVCCCKMETCLARDEEGMTPVGQRWTSRIQNMRKDRARSGDADVTNNLERL
ncbi:hypothetical protein TrRE_jg7572, partial [Triparma retinervis]